MRGVEVVASQSVRWSDTMDGLNHMCAGSEDVAASTNRLIVPSPRRLSGERVDASDDVRGSTNSDRNTTSPECRSIRITNTRLWLKNIGIGHRRSADSVESTISALFQHLRKHARARRPGPPRRLRAAHRTLSTGPPQAGPHRGRTGARQTTPTSNATAKPVCCARSAGPPPAWGESSTARSELSRL